MDILATSIEHLTAAGFVTARESARDSDALVFEDGTVLGFIICYADAAKLIAGWAADAAALMSRYQLSLRRSEQKAWNAYVVCLTAAEATVGEVAVLSSIEEDLTGTRKIVRSDVRDSDDVRAALLPLLPIQSAPKLDPVDIEQEVRQRATELPQHSVDAFFSSGDLNTVLQILEGG